MFRIRNLIIFSALLVSQAMCTTAVEAGPLLDWLFHRNRCNRPAFQAFRPQAAPCNTCTTTCQQTCQRVVVNYVPVQSFRTSWERVPVTTFRQSTSTDPCTGCQVTCNRPCTTFTWRMKQEPFTTFRPVYRTETFRTPVTFTSAAPAACNTCAIPQTVNSPIIQSPPSQQSVIQTPPTSGGTYYQTIPGGGSGAQPTPTFGGEGSGARTSPADTVPSLLGAPASNGASYWPTQINTQPTSIGRQLPSPTQPVPAVQWNNNATPQLQNPFNRTTSKPATERWGYSPVKLASYEAPVPAALRREPAAAAKTEYVGQVESNSPVRTSVNSGWQSSPGSNSSAGSASPQQRLNEGWRRD